MNDQIRADDPGMAPEDAAFDTPGRGRNKGGRNKGGGRKNKNKRSGNSTALVRVEKKNRTLAAQEEAGPAFSAPPVAEPARMKRRHWGLMLSFFLMVAVPLGGIVYYLWTDAVDQYASITGFTVRSEESGASSDLLGGVLQIGGSSTLTDSNILYEFIQSQEMVSAVDARLDLRAHYSQPWPGDWVFSIWPDATLEELVWYWQRIVRVAFDEGSGLIEFRVQAFDPETARAVAQAIVSEAEQRINALNETARTDAMRYAEADLEEAVARLKSAREALTQFRTRTQIVDPAADIQSRLGVMANLQQQLADALVEYDTLRLTARENDPRLTKALQRIDVIRERIVLERQAFTSDSTDTGAVGEDYPSLIAEFESLSVDREFAEETYRAALAALEVARDDAARKSRYLATYIQPSLPQTAEYPQREIITALAGLFLLLVWAISALIYYSIRDRG